MKTRFIVSLAFIVLASFTLKKTLPIEIEWSKDFKLTPEHFQRIESFGLGDNKAATISTQINLNTNWQGTFRPRATAIMNTRLSLMKTGLNDAQMKELLNHEKRHFDLTELIVRWENSELHTIRDANVAINIHNKYVKKLDSLQVLYDVQTDHCLNISSQLAWNNKIDSLLKLGY